MFDKKEFIGRKPDFSSREGVQIWKNLDKNGNEFLTVSIPLLNIRSNCFKTDGSGLSTNGKTKDSEDVQNITEKEELVE